MVEMGLEAYRFSISWSRLIPSNDSCDCKILDTVTGERMEILEIQAVSSFLLLDGRGAVNPKGLLYYNNLIDELISHGSPER